MLGWIAHFMYAPCLLQLLNGIGANCCLELVACTAATDLKQLAATFLLHSHRTIGVCHDCVGRHCLFWSFLRFFSAVSTTAAAGLFLKFAAGLFLGALKGESHVSGSLPDKAAIASGNAMVDKHSQTALL